MKSIPQALFGHVGFIVTVDPNEKWKDVVLGENGLVTSGIYYYTKGAAKVKVKETNEQLEDRVPGWLNTEHSDASSTTPGTLELRFDQETEWVCIPHEHNKSGIPIVTSLNLNSNSTASLKNNDNLFLVRGELTISGKTFVGPTRIRVRNGDVEVTSGNDKVYALLITPII